ncbi:hypothetical protein CQW23_14082 [Capsicum baccatum]|uniref:SOSEKI DIX-like domain-containing protein n=1 Tax=Capsicum baccatum TaxID=33114 RepID=A0A2G2WI58_CAPBA|nr:hypothetical protein CQW23_14082 [Capsicum baccatum]
MGERMKNYRQLGPERAKVWTEKIPKYQQQQPQQTDGKVPVVYYLCRNQQLDHPHFMEVPMSSYDGLYLRGNMALVIRLDIYDEYDYRNKGSNIWPYTHIQAKIKFQKLDFLTRNKRLMSLRFEDEEYFCASWTESIITKEKQQSSFFPRQIGSQEIQLKVKRVQAPNAQSTLNNPSMLPWIICPKNESLSSHLSEDPGISAEGIDSLITITSAISS